MVSNPISIGFVEIRFNAISVVVTFVHLAVYLKNWLKYGRGNIQLWQKKLDKRHYKIMYNMALTGDITHHILGWHVPFPEHTPGP